MKTTFAALAMAMTMATALPAFAQRPVDATAGTAASAGGAAGTIGKPATAASRAVVPHTPATPESPVNDSFYRAQAGGGGH
jgi:hypothetical protein